MAEMTVALKALRMVALLADRLVVYWAVQWVEKLVVSWD